MELYTRAEPDPLLDVGVAHALLERAAQTGAGSLMLWHPLRPALSLGRLDIRDRRSPQLTALARDAGATVVRRLAGGRAATLDAGCLCLGWAQPHARLEQSSARYQLLADTIIGALGDLGIYGSVGEAPGEWCPGAWSVQGPHGKLAGLAQRQIAGAAWCEALIVIERPPMLALLSRRVHELLNIPWRETAHGELAALLPGQPDLHARLSDALVRALHRQWPALERRTLPVTVGDRALRLSANHRWP
ncbi:MAG: lipoyl protein ligase domain-containing protein [Solirubrobacteraceae bacterium]